MHGKSKADGADDIREHPGNQEKKRVNCETQCSSIPSTMHLLEQAEVFEICPPDESDMANLKRNLKIGYGVSLIRRCPAITSMTPARIVSIARTPDAVTVSSAIQSPSNTARIGFT